MAEIGPLSSDDLLQLEASLLPSLERHHLRLLAHSLRCLQAIAGQRQGPVPAQQQLESWLASQDSLYNDPAFAQAFLDQLQSAAFQLEQIAAPLGLAPLGLELSDLCQWADAQARARVSPPAAGLPAPPPN
ncbi:hypothetical protein KQ302_12240 [Synechococcus sp. CS-602]|uniref:hypothetical protein n=1 Tax=Synechococcaceae TaxID=1890426 RepID=UPI0008FF5615|nr:MULTISPECIES: hypothetical protein [Synechococcaceae]MCT4363972.1 hypothetical protein [Candidatus Regnicoccus frigidus MAG-AL1]APD48416.1 hypothetical protein BM449_09420 [Synechococcus sp. SynAce01]MCT0201310.1 hypothetical protein [Synechococcus sp. CS-603]MCT0205860.1 hypothetical protein [Synechococcus sp. CS-602]MCT0245966.1 hypothetical protein [Synechococcus sp. CS-601]